MSEQLFTINALGEMYVGDEQVTVDDLPSEHRELLDAWDQATDALYADPLQEGSAKYRFSASTKNGIPALVMSIAYVIAGNDKESWHTLSSTAKQANGRLRVMYEWENGDRQVSVDFSVLGKTDQELASLRTEWDAMAEHLWARLGITVF